jgi:hypothetical protein
LLRYNLANVLLTEAPLKSHRPAVLAFALYVLFGAPQATTISADQSSDNSARPEDMKRLQDDLAGTWTIRETDEPTSTSGKPLFGEGTETYRTEKGGMPMVEEYHSMIAGKEATETAYFWFDASAHRLKGLWCAPTNGEGCGPFRIQRKGNLWIMEGEFVAGGERLAWHETYEKPGLDAFTQVLRIGKPGGELKLAATIHATRQK